jgi:serine/threonine-protein kinase
LNEANLVQSIVRRGLATPQEVEACKSQRAKALAESSQSGIAKSLLESMIDAGVLTRSQAGRLLKEQGDSGAKLEIPGYTIIERIGKGSMGLVYKAKQTSVNRIVAVKVLLDALARNRDFINRFRREAEIAAKLSHNNIVGVMDAGQVGTSYYFVMEFVDGETIKDILDKGRIFDEKTALEIVIKIADALKHAHQKGLIHRDIKPENIILTKDRNVKLADLGLARPTADEKWALAEQGMAIGTPYYISPEQVGGRVDIDIRADIYGLGATLYHMVTGRVPFPGDDPNEVMRKHANPNCLLEPPDHLNTKLSSGIGVVVETMMAKDRDNRYRNPEDLLLDLKCLLAGDRPMIAEQKADALEALAAGEAQESDEIGAGVSSVTEDEKREMAAIANRRMNMLAAALILLGVSVVSNLILLLAR